MENSDRISNLLRSLPYGTRPEIRLRSLKIGTTSESVIWYKLTDGSQIMISPREIRKWDLDGIEESVDLDFSLNVTFKTLYDYSKKTVDRILELQSTTTENRAETAKISRMSPESVCTIDLVHRIHSTNAILSIESHDDIIYWLAVLKCTQDWWCTIEISGREIFSGPADDAMSIQKSIINYENEVK